MGSLDSVYEKAPPYSSSSAAEPLYVGEADYWKYYYQSPEESYEWNNGKLEKRPMPDFLSFAMYLWFARLLEDYLKAYSEGRIMGGEMGFRLNFGQKITIRKPDLAIIHRNNPTPYELTDRSFKGICDICIEFLSDSTPEEVERDTVVKKQEYAQAGVQEYFILDRLHKETTFYRLPPAGTSPIPKYEPIVPSLGGVIQSQVLSQFAFRLEHLHSLPEFENLTDDSVYQPFVVKPYQEEKQAKEAALNEVEQERHARKQERHAKEEALKQIENERHAKEQERHAKEEALKQIENERHAKEQERHAKEEALRQAERERHAREQERLAKKVALETAEQERLAREALEVELKQLHQQIHKDT